MPRTRAFFSGLIESAQIEKLVRKEENIYTVDKYANLMAESQKRITDFLLRT